jgi:hypothetical protein
MSRTRSTIIIWQQSKHDNWEVFYQKNANSCKLSKNNYHTSGAFKLQIALIILHIQFSL